MVRACPRCPRQPDGKPTLVPANRWRDHQELHAAQEGRLRVPVSRRLRDAILASQGWRCALCGTDISGRGQAFLDHKNGLAGDNRRENLRGLCDPCHRAKHRYDQI